MFNEFDKLRGDEAIKRLATSAYGTFETCRRTLRMSVCRGRAEVVGSGSERRVCPISDIGSALRQWF
jgi:hypothetical protein